MRTWMPAALTAIVLAFAGSVPALAAHHAPAPRDCATHGEYEQVKMDMSPKRVRGIFGYRGERQRLDDTRFVLYWYSCKGQKAAVVWFENGAGSYKKKWDTVR